jgi:DNA-binding NtrC family response regulator
MARILVIDDAAPIRLLLATALESAGHEVVQASSGREGLTLYRQRSLDLVILDMLMPELNGLETMQEFTREFQNVKVIVLSGGGAEHAMLKTARLLGVRQTLNKPFDLEDLLSAVRHELAH